MFKFGFKSVEEEEKKSLVSGVFNSVAERYDLMNNIMSFGLQKLWKKDFCDLIHLKEGGKYLDLACGDGDISSLIIKKAKKEDKNISLVLCDASEEMLEKARKRFEGEDVCFELCFAEDLLSKEEAFDGIFVSFGIRNFTNINKALEGISKSLKKDGDFFCLEFFRDVSESLYFHKIYKQYLLKVIPKIGSLITKNEDAYKYFGESIINFYSKAEFVELLQNSHFRLFSSLESVFSIATFFHFKNHGKA